MPSRNTGSKTYWEAEVIGEDILKKITQLLSYFTRSLKMFSIMGILTCFNISHLWDKEEEIDEVQRGWDFTKVILLVGIRI